MRTDAKIGFAIGGVLLAVLAVYLIVVPPKHKETKKPVVVAQAPEVTPETPAVVPAVATTPPPVVNDNGGGVALNTPPGLPTTPLTAEDDHNKPAIPDTHSASNDNKFHPSDPAKAPDTGGDVASGGLFRGENTGGADLMQSPASSDDHVKSASHKSSGHREHIVTAEHTVTTTARQYSVKSGQTLSGIASDVYGNARFWVAIQRENAGLDARHLKVGQKINLPDISDVRPNGPVLVDVLEPAATAGGTEIEPTAHTYRVQSGDSLYKISKKLFGTGHRASAIYELNKDLIGDDDAKLKLGMLLKLPEGAQRSAISSIAQ